MMKTVSRPNTTITVYFGVHADTLRLREPIQADRSVDALDNRLQVYIDQILIASDTSAIPIGATPAVPSVLVGNLLNKI